jgi:ribosomal protein S18 acetylase RimI-like enzyme
LNIRSLGRRTDLIFSKISGSVTDKGSYTLIQTPSNPGFHWGNFIVFDHAPAKGSLKEWKAIFDREFGYYAEPHHYVFTWDTGKDDQGDHQEFLDANFEFDSASVLTATKLNPPPYLNDQIVVRKITSDQDWDEVLKLQIICAKPKFRNDYYEEFKKRQRDDYRKMSESGMGAWFGAFLGDKMVGDLGIFYEGNIGRYQNVGTHPDCRRQGICGTLVYQAGQLALQEFGINHLVMEADINYHAARIYESVGFKRTEVNYALSWWKSKELNAEK